MTSVETPPAPSDEVLNRTRETIANARELGFASFDELMTKPKRKAYPRITVQDADGRPIVRRLQFEALDPVEFDALQAAYPATPAQKEKGASWNPDDFQPALIAAVCAQPPLTLAQARALFTNPNYATGERQGLFFAALDVCGGGLDVPFTAGD